MIFSPLRLFLLFIFAASFFPGINRAASTPRPSTIEYLKWYPRDSRTFFTAPLRWRYRGWTAALALAGITTGLYQFDSKINRRIQDNRSPAVDNISRAAKPFGDGRLLLPILGAYYLHGRLAGSGRSYRTALVGLESFLFSGLITQTLKQTFHRHRPSSGSSPTTWDGPRLDPHNLSFPSGHAASAFSVATVIAELNRDRWWIRYPCYLIAAGTAWSRVNDNYHWASDVFLGSAIGFTVGKFLVFRHEATKKKPSISLDTFSRGRVGFVITI